MKFSRGNMSINPATLLCLAAVDRPRPRFGARADVITDWNAKAEAIAVEKRLLPPPNARGMAILHIAMFEAVNAVDRRYAPYRLKLAAERTVSKEAAAASAAHAVLIALHPDQQVGLDATLMASLAQIAEGDSKTKGDRARQESRSRDSGVARQRRRRACRKAIVRSRQRVSMSPPSSRSARPTAASAPWVITSGSQFRPAPPPALSSATWAKDVNEIREFGGRANSKRTAEQTDIGRFWFVTGPQAWNPIVRQLAASKKLDIVDSARLFALVAIATDDAFIAVFDAKYHYNFWRPVTAIRNADLSDNSGHVARSVMVAARRHADASGIPVRALHHLGGRGDGAAIRVRKRDTGGLDDQPNGAGRHPDDGRACRITPMRSRWPASTAAFTTASRTSPDRTWVARSRSLPSIRSCALPTHRQRHRVESLQSTIRAASAGAARSSIQKHRRSTCCSLVE